MPSQEMKRESGDFSFEKIRKKNRGSPTEEFELPEDRDGPSKPKSFRKSAPPSQSFRCKKCRAMVGGPFSGTTQRNHCPACLFSVHVDTRPGDRAAECGSSMEPISIWVRGDEWVLLHRCMGCGVIHSNRIAPDDNETLLLSLAARPLGKPAFPLYSYAEEERT